MVSAFTDPFLVTKLPQETSVVSGVIRLGERTVLGFLHQPFPDGTRVRVVYREWLLAERIEESASGPADPVAAAEEVKPAEEPKSAEQPKPVEEAKPAEEPKQTKVEPGGQPGEAAPAEAEPDAAEPDAAEPDAAKPETAGPKGAPAKAEPEETPAAVDAEDDPASHEGPAQRKREQRPGRGRASGSDDAGRRNVFPEDLTGTDEDDGDRGKEDDPWTDAFRRGRKRRGDED